mmetsp:Transcript_18292/g.61692  ORF Transcript_18292/g.61692 Transcript_18292/m.61692 type:complete len:235 (+) Transcript_18292:548-1252(+)
MEVFFDLLCRLGDLRKSEPKASHNVKDHARRSSSRRVDQRARNRLLRRQKHAALALGLADAHQRGAGVGHGGPDVCEVDVDESGFDDQVCDSRDALSEDVVCNLKGHRHRRILRDDLEQTVVGDHDQSVDGAPKLLDGRERLLVAPPSFEREGPRHDTHGQSAHLLCNRCHHGRRARPGAAAHARGDEDHVRPGTRFANLQPRLLGGLAAYFGLAARAEAARHLAADVHSVWCL